MRRSQRSAAATVRRYSTSLPPFLVERWEGWNASGLQGSLSSSECEPLTMRNLLSLSDEENLARWESLSLGYTHQKGNEFLRRDIADYINGSNEGKQIQLNPEDVLVCTPSEGILLAVQASLKPEDHVICVKPGYQSLYQLAQTMGCEVTPWEARLDGESFRFETDTLRQILRPGKTKLLVLQFPNNPTGALPTQEEYQYIVDMCKSIGCRVFSDEMYRELEHAGECARLPSAAVMARSNVTLGGVSKVFSLPGLRIGWVATKDYALMRRMEELKDYTTICSSSPSEVLASIGIRAKDIIVGKNRETVKFNLQACRNFFTGTGKISSELFEWHEPHGGTFCYPRMKQDKWGHLTASSYARSMCRDGGIMFLPSSTFFCEDDDRLRITYGKEETCRLLQAWELDLRCRR